MRIVMERLDSCVQQSIHRDTVVVHLTVSIVNGTSRPAHLIIRTAPSVMWARALAVGAISPGSAFPSSFPCPVSVQNASGSPYNALNPIRCPRTVLLMESPAIPKTSTLCGPPMTDSRTVMTMAVLRLPARGRWVRQNVLAGLGRKPVYGSGGWNGV